MQSIYYLKQHLLSILFLLVACNTQAALPDIITRLQFKQLSTRNGLPNDEVQKVYQDKDGFMWFATRYGLCKYDGYDVTLFKSNFNTPDLFTNNNVQCMVEDNDHNLWIGTLEGLNILNKETGQIRKGVFPAIGTTAISSLLVTRDNTVWIGTDAGLAKYDKETDNVVFYAGEVTGNLLFNVAIKALIEDSDGDIWIGTWSDGLYRFSVSTGEFFKYPWMNARNSAHTIYQDSQGDIWVGTWKGGLFKLHNPKDMDKVWWTNYRHNQSNAHSLSDDIIYSICEDVNTHTLWVGTRSGLSIMDLQQPDSFINYMPNGSTYYLGCNEINSIERDDADNMWIGTLGGGVLMVDTRKPVFNMYRFDLVQDDIPTNTVRSIFVDSDENLWLGVGTYGLACHNRSDNAFMFYSRIPEFSDVTSMPTVYSIIQRRKSGEVWMGTYDGGLFVYKEGRKVINYNDTNSDFIKYICITALYEDKRGNCWVGTRMGFGVQRADNTGHVFRELIVDGMNLEWAYVRDITEDSEGNIWLATANNGIIRVKGDVNQPENLVYASYGITNDKIMTKSVMCLHCDSRGRLWAGTESHGLFLYDKEKDEFIPSSSRYNLPGDMVGSIEEDLQGNLWLGTNSGLVCMEVPSAEEVVLRVYTAADGLQDNFFIPKSSFMKNGELFFGGYKGYNSFFPQELNDECRHNRFAITDIKIFNRSFSTLDDKLRNRISSETPSFTRRIEIPYKYNNFSIEFASLTYKNPELNKYAYQLDGFEREWQYTDANRHFANYNNLKSGTYTFRLKATNENGIWSNQIREILVVVLPPFWATWWAYLIYILTAALIIYFIYRTGRNRIMLKNRIQLQEMEKAQSEELNHSKLQFFTNITHELLTPLTIISATIDELKMRAPQYGDIYTVVSTNIQRLIRLLQQILEFRKAETGNLKLRVSPGDVVAFVRNEAEAFQPLIKKRKLHFSLLVDPESINGYFDTDKLDKILYNLLSNAAKYNKEGGFIQLNLGYADDKDYILITVADNGRGISRENQKTLFKRFYEGDYRKVNTIGTGIGLSLVKDLVTLHGGKIWVESELGKGSSFFVKLPIDRSYYKKDEIDEEIIPLQKTVSGIDSRSTEQLVEKQPQPHSILVLEDNEDLLQLMLTLLGREYNVFTGSNGKEGIEILENEDIDLIVSDIMMPEMDGIAFTCYVKGKLEFSHVPIILLTAKNKEEDRAEAYESGADAFISKPFNLNVLHARIKNLLKSKERMARDFKNQLIFEVKDLNYTSIDEDFMQRAIDCVNRHLDDPNFDQPQFIEEMGTSKSTLYKKLKSLTGLNTSAFIRNIRLKAAVRIMEEKRGVRVSELAYAVGFNDPKYFSSCFKKEFNMLPSEYIERFIPEQEQEG